MAGQQAWDRQWVKLGGIRVDRMGNAGRNGHWAGGLVFSQQYGVPIFSGGAAFDVKML